MPDAVPTMPDTVPAQSVATPAAVPEVLSGPSAAEVAPVSGSAGSAGTAEPTGHRDWDRATEALLTGEPPAQTLSDRILVPPHGPVRGPGPRRGPADPVKLLMHRHHRLCEWAVDPLEIAAGLEAHGITDRTAARFRHRDVFSLAEELYARVPRATDVSGSDVTAVGGTGADGVDVRGVDSEGTGATRSSAAQPVRGPGQEPGRTGWAGWTALSFLPGAVCALTLAGLERTSGQSGLAIAVAGALALSAALSSCLRRGPLRAEGRTVPAAGLWMYWLLAYLVCGDGLLDALVGGGPSGPWHVTLTPLLVLAFGVPAAAWCIRLFSAQARRLLTDSRGLADFAAVTRPLLLFAVGLNAAVLTGLSLLAALAADDDGAAAPTVALGTLLLLARLLTVHGFPDSAATGLAAACLAEALCCLSVAAGRLPGCDALAVPVTGLVHAWGAGAVSVLACGAAALGLLIHAAVALSRASAHT